MIIKFPDNREEQIQTCGETIEKILIRIGIEPMEVLVTRGDEVIPEDTIPKENESIRLIRISHGG